MTLSCGEDAPVMETEETEEVSTIELTSRSRSTTDHNRNYFYLIRASSTINNEISYTVSKPSWIEFNEEELTLTGTPGWGRVNTSFNITVMATNEVDTATQSFAVEVALGEIICSSDFGSSGTSEYVLPYRVGHGYKLSQSYCPSNPQWGHHNWFAYDFDMPIGTDLVAMREGQVIATQANKLDGNRDCTGNSANFVFVLHDDGTVAQYVHLTTGGVFVEVGERVSQGQLIGESGDSGCSIGPHTHVAVFRQRGPYNRQYTMPFNFSNTNGVLDANNGLVQDEYYTALEF